MGSKKKRSMFISTLAFFAIIGEGSLIIISILMFIGMIDSNGLEIIFLLLAIFSMILTYGFLTAKSWSRIFFILYLIVVIIGILYQNISQILITIYPIASLAIVIFLLTRPNVKGYFASS